MDLNDLDRMVAVHTLQIGRIVSDIESEKRTRADVNKTIIERLGEQDREMHKSAIFQAKLIGAVLALNFIVGIVVTVIAAKIH